MVNGETCVMISVFLFLFWLSDAGYRELLGTALTERYATSEGRFVFTTRKGGSYGKDL